MYHKRDGNTIAVRLHVGEEVHESLLAVCEYHGVTGAYVVSGIGMLKDPLLGWYDIPAQKYHEQRFPGLHELLNLSGNVSLREGALMCHLHVTLADEEYRSFGGHLFGSEVGLTLEVVLLVLPGVNMQREVEPEFGLPGLQIS
ncbi:MAG: DNA-binding protein [bacterium]|nr:DNA-binding protein [bacterium]